VGSLKVVKDIVRCIRSHLRRLVMSLKCHDIDCVLPKDLACTVLVLREKAFMYSALWKALINNYIDEDEYRELCRKVGEYGDMLYERCLKLYDVCCG